jgi:hypothetical protein
MIKNKIAEIATLKSQKTRGFAGKSQLAWGDRAPSADADRHSPGGDMAKSHINRLDSGGGPEPLGRLLVDGHFRL